MSGIQQYRNVPDLIDMIALLQERVERLERGRRLGNSSIDNGEFTVRNGDITVRDPDDNVQLRLRHGYKPSVEIHSDTATDSYYLKLHAYNIGGMTAAQIMTHNAAGNGDGGKVLLTKNYAYLSHQPIGEEETYLSLSGWNGYPNHFFFRGKWISDEQVASYNALYMGTITVAAGFTGIIWNYDYTYPAVPLLMYSITGSAAFRHRISSTTTTGFQIDWDDTLAHNVNFMVWRR